MNIIKKCSTVHTSLRGKNKIEYIVIHYTAGVTSKKGTAQSLATYFANSTANASADFIVDDKEIVQYNPDMNKYYTWAVGGSKYKQTKGGTYYGKCKNANSISIEICSNNKTGSITKVNDTNYYFTQDSVKNALELTRYLMKVYNIPISNVIRHYDVTGKVCPGIIGWNEASGNVLEWVAFKGMLVVTDTPDVTVKPSKDKIKSFTVQVLVSNLNIRNKPNMDGKVKGQTGKGRFTIVDEQGDWGLLKSYEVSRDGWIYLGNKNYVKRL